MRVPDTGTGRNVLQDSPTINTPTISGATLSSPIVGTQSPLDNSTKAASTAYVDAAVTAAVTGSLKVLHVQDEKAAATAGGTFTSGAWRTRDLNTVTVNQITGASLASNKVTLPAGTYFAQWAAPAYFVDRHQSKLYNVTDAADIAIGAGAYSATALADAEITESQGSGYFVLAGVKDIELRHRCQTTDATNGFGFGMNLGVVEVYGRLTILKLP